MPQATHHFWPKLLDQRMEGSDGKNEVNTPSHFYNF